MWNLARGVLVGFGKARRGLSRDLLDELVRSCSFESIAVSGGRMVGRDFLFRF